MLVAISRGTVEERGELEEIRFVQSLGGDQRIDVLLGSDEWKSYSMWLGQFLSKLLDARTWQLANRTKDYASGMEYWLVFGHSSQ
jgi:hypothetical protein